ncbi:hypothetical protein [Gymnodinialimonas sp.]
MAERAILMVPGFDRVQREQIRDALANFILCDAQAYKVSETQDRPSAGKSYVGLNAISRDDPSKALDLRVYEVFWSDIIPDYSAESTWEKFKRATMLVAYWGLYALRSSRPAIPSWSRVWLIGAGLLLLLWYLLVTVAFLNLIASNPSLIPEPIADALSRLRINVENISDFWSDVLAFWPVAFILLLVGNGRLETVANIAQFAKVYLGDERSAPMETSLRSKLRKRATDQLDIILGDPDVEEVFVVAHSFGGAIAVDALAEFGSDLPRVHLFTWGTVLGVFAHQQDWIRRDLEHLQDAKPSLASWTDYRIRRDSLAVPVPKISEKAQITHVDLPAITTLPLPSQQAHNAYYSSQKAIEALLVAVPPVSAAQVAGD